jgi:glutamine cyclotransferase
MDPETGESLTNLNELEMVGGELYINILDFNVETFLIVRVQIDGESMSVVRTYDFCLLYELVCDELAEANIDQSCSTVREMNGIAYYSPESAFVLTGKEWPSVFMVTLDDNTAI